MEKNMINDEAMENVAGGAARINCDTGTYILYRVVSGDCLSVIALRNNVTTEVLYAINQKVIGPNPDRIIPGMILKIPTL